MHVTPNIALKADAAAVNAALALKSDLVGDHEVSVFSPSGTGSTNTRIRKYSAVQRNVGTAITYTSSAVNGDSWTINQTGLYAISYTDGATNGSRDRCVAKNSGNLTPLGVALADLIGVALVTVPVSTTGVVVCASAVVRLTAGDVIRVHMDDAYPADVWECGFRIRKVNV